MNKTCNVKSQSLPKLANAAVINAQSVNTKTHNHTIISQCTRVEITSWLNATYTESQISLQNELNLRQAVIF